MASETRACVKSPVKERVCGLLEVEVEDRVSE
jgi:hypothetical protein